MEELLNKLIKKGRVPFRDYDIAEFNQIGNTFVAINYESKVIGQPKLRQIVSKESLLRQFVCDREHRFINERNYDGVSLDKRLKNPYVDYDGVNTEYEWITGLDYQYWLIESSLKDEDELEQFLLDNIKIDEKKS